MELLSIVLCFVSGIIVTSVVMILFEMKREINGLKQQIHNMNTIQKDIETLYRENGDMRLVIDEKRSTLVSEMYRNIEHTESTFKEVYRYIDSRHDKLETKLIDIVKNGYEPIKSK